MKRLPITMALMLLLALPLMAGADDQGWIPPEWTATPPAQPTSKTGQRGSRLWDNGKITPRGYAHGAFAQERPASAQPEHAGRLSAAEASSRIPWETISWAERRYKIEAMRFKARDESGFDWWGSDEVMVGTFDPKGWTVSEKIGDINSGDTYPFDPAKSCIVSVQPGIVVLGKTSVCAGSEPAPLRFRVEFWEKDPSGYPTAFCPGSTPLPGYHGSTHCLNDLSGDDFLGRAQIDLSAQELEAALPQVGDEYIETVVLDPCPGQQCAGFPDYTFTYRITRLPDAQVGLLPVLHEAMQKSGARSELEAVVAGLRALHAPSPRTIEPERGNLPPERQRTSLRARNKRQ